MLEKIKATITHKEDKSIIASFAGVEFKILANPNSFKLGEEETIFTHLSWNQETGPSLLGFKTSYEKDAFKILVECPKIGPALAIGILGQVDAASLFSMICKDDERGLSKINGVGPKSAKNLISFLRSKATTFLQKNGSVLEEISPSDTVLIDIREALSTLGYSGGEISNVISTICKQETPSELNQGLRQAFEILQKQK